MGGRCRVLLDIAREKSNPRIRAFVRKAVDTLPDGDCVHELFEAQVQRRPDAVAVVFEEQRMTYRQLNHRANQLAGYLQSLGIGRETLVAMCVERSLDMIVGVLAILKAGAAYVPIDAGYPPERIKLILEDARPSVMLADAHLLASLSGACPITLCPSQRESEIGQHSSDNPRLKREPSSLAYVIYTSGSTGRPKGVEVEHRSVLELFKATDRLIEFTPDDVWTVFHSFAFDLSVWEIFGCLLHGGRLVIVPRELLKSPRDFYRLLATERVTVLSQTPSAARQLLYACRRLERTHLEALSLRIIICGGEALPVEVARQLLDWRVPLWNFYGPTEATVWTIAKRIKEADCKGDRVAIGKPFPGVEAFILNEQLLLVAPGDAGELYLGGRCLARGYLRQPDLTKERFIPHPFSSDPAERLYKTGDQARLNKDGDLLFLGRIDEQVKVSGFRVELGEIEAALAQHPGIQQAVVNLWEDANREKRLAAYLVAAKGSRPDITELRTFLRRKLPDYMLPAAFVWLKSVPLSSNGKVDRKALPTPEELNQEHRGPIAAPTDALQIQLKNIWESVLRIQPIGMRDNFFDLGGDSLLAVALFCEIEIKLGKDLPLSMLLQYPTIEQLAAAIREEDWSRPWSSLVPIRQGGSGRPFFCVHAAGGNVLNYFDLARRIGVDRPFYGVQAYGLVGKQEPHRSVEEMAAHYLREIRGIQPEGPYLIGGESFGGIVAFEMARQLLADNHVVPVLILLDATAGPDHLGPLRDKIAERTRVMMHLPTRDRPRYLLNQLRSVGPAIAARMRRSQAASRDYATKATNTVPDIGRINDEAHRKYVPAFYPGRALLFRARESFWTEDLGWGKLVGRLEVKEVPGTHFDFITEPNVQHLAEELRIVLREAERTFLSTEADPPADTVDLPSRVILGVTGGGH